MSTKSFTNDETHHLRTRERPFALEWEALDLNHSARYYAAPDATEEDLATQATRGNRIVRAGEDPLKILWDLD